MAPHTWSYLGDTVSDATHHMYYRGQRIKEAYYRGEKIWGEEDAPPEPVEPIRCLYTFYDYPSITSMPPFLANKGIEYNGLTFCVVIKIVGDLTDDDYADIGFLGEGRPDKNSLNTISVRGAAYARYAYDSTAYIGWYFVFQNDKIEGVSITPGYYKKAGLGSSVAPVPVLTLPAIELQYNETDRYWGYNGDISPLRYDTYTYLGTPLNKGDTPKLLTLVNTYHR